MLNISKTSLFKWEEEGLISPVTRDWHGWRRYDSKHIAEIRKLIEEKQKNAPGVLLPKVLVADDDQGIIDLLVEALKREGYPVFSALDGEEAMRKYREERPGLLFLDVKMPGVNGIEILRQIRQKDKKTVIVMMTGYPETRDTVTALKEGALNYLAKPINIDEVVAIARKVLGEGKR